MRVDGLRARPQKRFECMPMGEHAQPIAVTVFDRPLTTVAPTQRWVSHTRPMHLTPRLRHEHQVLALHARNMCLYLGF